MTLATNAVMAWTTEYFGLAVDAEIAQLGPSGCRPLRARDTLF